jgi:hypothetical protein
MARPNDTARAAKRRYIVARYKTLTGCTDCGYNEDARALEFDHLPGTEKLGTVASMMYKSWEKIKQEIRKCEVVCANCHSIRTHER